MEDAKSLNAISALRTDMLQSTVVRRVGVDSAQQLGIRQVIVQAKRTRQNTAVLTAKRTAITRHGIDYALYEDTELKRLGQRT
jgi:hypothetical protein